MAAKRLNTEDIDELLANYRAERRRLNFQLTRVREAIAELKAVRDGKPIPARSGAKPATTKATRRKPGRRKKREIKDGGYRLNPWDLMVIELIRSKDRLLPKEDIMAHAHKWAAKNEPKMSSEEVEAKVTRTLQKLSGKRGELGTHRTGLRRGYHYGIKDWFFATSGKLKKAMFDKLVLS